MLVYLFTKQNWSTFYFVFEKFIKSNETKLVKLLNNIFKQSYSGIEKKFVYIPVASRDNQNEFIQGN